MFCAIALGALWRPLGVALCLLCATRVLQWDSQKLQKHVKTNGLGRFLGILLRRPTQTTWTKNAFPCSVRLVFHVCKTLPCSVTLIFIDEIALPCRRRFIFSLCHLQSFVMLPPFLFVLQCFCYVTFKFQRKTQGFRYVTSVFCLLYTVFLMLPSYFQGKIEDFVMLPPDCVCFIMFLLCYLQISKEK